MGEDYIREKAGSVGIKPEEYPAKNLAERMLRAGGEGAAFALAPQAGLEATAARTLGQAAKSPVGITARETAEKVFGASRPGSLAATSGNIGVNVGGGMGAAAIYEML